MATKTFIPPKPSVKYKILYSNSREGMEDLVNNHIEDGWQLAGSMTTPVYYHYKDEKWYYEFFQPMVKVVQLDSIQTTGPPEPASEGEIVAETPIPENKEGALGPVPQKEEDE